MNREDFNILNQNIIYFDNAATSLKPKKLLIVLLIIITTIVLMHIEVTII